MDRLTEISAERIYAESRKVVDAVRSAKIICHMKAFEPGSYPVIAEKEDALAIVDALQEQAEREKGCEYCDFSSGDVGATINNCGDDLVLIRSEDGVSIATDDNHFKIAKINFCPVCGRDLRKPVE